MKTKNNKQSFAVLALVAILAFSFGALAFSGIAPQSKNNSLDSDSVALENMAEHRANFLSYRNAMQDELRNNNMYRCCLENPCTYCIEKTPGHGEGAACDCLEDIVEGRHPCGECIGEILEGHGNPYLAEYFAVAIAEEVGTQHVGTLREIIAEKYGLPIEKQL